MTVTNEKPSEETKELAEASGQLESGPSEASENITYDDASDESSDKLDTVDELGEPFPLPTDAPPAQTRSTRSRWALVSNFMIRAVTIVLSISVIWVCAYRFISPPATLTMLERKLSGEVIVHPWTSYRDISPNLVAAVIAAEDSKFCRHWGFDLGEMKAAIKDARAGKGLRGASTISQQTAKNAFLWNGGGFIRKSIEAWYTGWIELLWPKRRTMEVYLNIAEWGDGLFGANAAAQARFGKSARTLTRQEAALLAAVLPNPNKWRVDPPGSYVKRRANTIRKRMDTIRSNGWNHCAW